MICIKHPFPFWASYSSSKLQDKRICASLEEKKEERGREPRDQRPRQKKKQRPTNHPSSFVSLWLCWLFWFLVFCSPNSALALTFFLFSWSRQRCCGFSTWHGREPWRKWRNLPYVSMSRSIEKMNVFDFYDRAVIRRLARNGRRKKKSNQFFSRFSWRERRKRESMRSMLLWKSPFSFPDVRAM